MNERYASILTLERVYSEKHPRMPNGERAAQFAPFAALTGYDEAVIEMARLTTERVAISDDAAAELDHKFQMLQLELEAQPEVTIVYFKPDERKSGGAYLTKTGNVMVVDAFTHTIHFSDGSAIPIRDIYDLQGQLFDCLDEY